MAVATVALGFGFASTAFGLSNPQVYENCLLEYSGLDNECCDLAGGSWVEILDEKGNVIDNYCFVPDGEWELSTDTGPSWSDPRTGTTSTTHEQ